MCSCYCDVLWDGVSFNIIIIQDWFIRWLCTVAWLDYQNLLALQNVVLASCSCLKSSRSCAYVKGYMVAWCLCNGFEKCARSRHIPTFTKFCDKDWKHENTMRATAILQACICIHVGSSVIIILRLHSPEKRKKRERANDILHCYAIAQAGELQRPSYVYTTCYCLYRYGHPALLW